MKRKKRKGNPERITQQWLEKRLALVNSMMGNPEAAYTDTGSGLKQNQGHLYIDHAYGGVGVEEMARSGANAVSGGHVPKRELNTFIDGMIAALRLIDQRKRGRNPCGKKKVTRKKNCAGRKKNPGLFVVGRLLGNKVSFFNGGYPLTGVWGTRAKAAKYNLQSDGVKAAEAYLRKHNAKFSVFVIPASESTAAIRKKLKVHTPGKVKRGRNPVGPTQREIDSAHNLFKDFSGDHPDRLQNVRLPVPKTGLVIGELDGVLYTAIRDGKSEAYQHDFKKGSRPLLASSHDGESLHILGGEYEFTERGIEDK